MRILVLVFLLSWANCFAQDNTVLMVSFDGFRHDYAVKYQAPNFLKMAEAGVSTERLVPSFPSKTFPNHYTLVTGMYPGHHGLVDNAFYDPARSTRYGIRDREKVQDPYYYGGLPIWQVLHKNGIINGSFFWVGSETPINGIMPDYYKYYDGKVPNEARIDTVFSWFNLPKAQKPKFVSLYFSLTDDIGHRYGPDAPETKEAVLEADRLLGTILDKAKLIGVTVVVVSDHGMVGIENRPDTFFSISDIVNTDEVNVVNLGSHFHVYEKDKKKCKALLKQIKAFSPEIKAYAKKRIPKKYKYSHNARIGDILVTTSPKHVFTTAKPGSEKRPVWGAHGYDPYAYKEMSGIFYAVGPSLKSGVVLPPLKNVDVYPFVLKLLNIDGPRVDGSLKSTKDAFN